MAGLGEYLLRLAFWVAVVVGGLALLLTVSGLFSVLSYLVEQRRQEIGVRMALGASPGEVVPVRTWAVAPARRFRISRWGRACGDAGDRPDGHARRLTDQGPSSPNRSTRLRTRPSLLIILSACMLAATLPARRAARIDPITTLRQE